MRCRPEVRHSDNRQCDPGITKAKSHQSQLLGAVTDKKFANTDNNTFVWDQSTAFEAAVPIYNHRHIQPTQDCRCWVFEDTHTATRKSTQELNEAIRMAPAGTRSSGGATACVLQAWNAIQVKHSGRYSRCRMLALHEYSTATPLWKVATVAIMTPLPSLVIIALFEMVDLNPPSAGLELNRIFFAREWMTFTTFTVVLLQQFCTQVGQALPMTPLRLVGIACGTSALNVAFNYLLASFVGFPLPFTIQFSGLLHLVLECAALLISWRAYIRANPHVIAGIARAGMFFGWQCFTIVVYPVYYHAFTLVPDASVPRLACLLFLPAMKLTNRLVFLHMNRKSDGCEELSPQIVVLNADVVSALFVAFCMQYSPSLLMACIIAALKMTQVSLSLRDIYIVSQSVRSLQAEIQKQCSVKTKRRRGPKSSILDKVAEVHGHWAANHSILSDHGSSGASHVGLCCFSRRICSIHASRVSPLVPDPVVGCSRDNRALVHIGSAVKEQIWASKSEESQPDLQIRGEGTRHASPGLKSLEEQYVAAVAKLFYMVEFVVLVEYIEVIIPILYSLYLGIIFGVPNRVFFSQFADMDAEKLAHTVGNVLLYTSFEILSFAIVQFSIRRWVDISPVRLLGFVLVRQAVHVQSALILWMVYSTQASLSHYGSIWCLPVLILAWVKLTASRYFADIVFVNPVDYYACMLPASETASTTFVEVVETIEWNELNQSEVTRDELDPLDI